MAACYVLTTSPHRSPSGHLLFHPALLCCSPQASSQVSPQASRQRAQLHHCSLEVVLEHGRAVMIQAGPWPLCATHAVQQASRPFLIAPASQSSSPSLACSIYLLQPQISRIHEQHFCLCIHPLHRDAQPPGDTGLYVQSLENVVAHRKDHHRLLADSTSSPVTDATQSPPSPNVSSIPCWSPVLSKEWLSVICYWIPPNWEQVMLPISLVIASND